MAISKADLKTSILTEMTGQGFVVTGPYAYADPLAESLANSIVDGNGLTDLDDIVDGANYSKVAKASLTAGAVLLSQVIGDLDDVADGTYGKVLASALSTGSVLLSQATGDLDDIVDGTYGKVLLSDISGGHIVLGNCVGDLDDVADGTYGKVLVTDISAGHILLTECSGDLDDIADGTDYGKVLATDISAGHVLLAECSGDLDDVADGTYGKVLITDISAGHILLSETSGNLDDVADGTYGKVLATDIAAGHIRLSQCAGTMDDVDGGSHYGRVKVADMSQGEFGGGFGAGFNTEPHPLLAGCDGYLDDIADGGYGKILSTDISAGHIILTACIGDLDDIADGTYAKVLATDISAGHILLSEASGDLDDISDGSTYGKVAVTDISSGHILLAECSGDLDDIGEGSTYGKVAVTDISSGHIVLSTCDGDLDDVADGTNYGKVASTAIAAGVIVLTAGVGVSGSLPVANSDAKCTDADADQTSANTAADAAAYTGASIAVANTDAKCTDADADQTSANTAADAAAYTGSSISVSYTDAKCADADADQTSANAQNLGWLIGTTGTLTISSSGKLSLNTADALEIQAAGNIKCLAGSDIHLIGSDSDPGLIKWTGSSYNTEMGADVDGNRFGIIPLTDNVASIQIGASTGNCWWSAGYKRWVGVEIIGTGLVNLLSLNTSGRWGRFQTRGDLSRCELGMYDGTNTNHIYATNYVVKYLAPDSDSDKVFDFGQADYAWDDAYADDWNNVGDFFHMDTRLEDGQEVEIDDLGVIEGIQSSGEYDERTGMALIDDNTLPAWMLVKDYIYDEKTETLSAERETVRDPDGKPWLSNKMLFSLLMGAVRQLNQKVIDLEAQIT